MKCAGARNGCSKPSMVGLPKTTRLRGPLTQRPSSTPIPGYLAIPIHRDPMSAAAMHPPTSHLFLIHFMLDGLRLRARQEQPAPLSARRRFGASRSVVSAPGGVRSIGLFVPQQLDRSSRQNLQIQQRRPVPQVFEVVIDASLHLFELRCLATAAVDLR
jgi:hypothetical protein